MDNSFKDADFLIESRPAGAELIAAHKKLNLVALNGSERAMTCRVAQTFGQATVAVSEGLDYG